MAMLTKPASERVGREKDLGGEIGQSDAGHLQFVEQATMEVPPFQDDLPQIVALLPAVFPVLDGRIRMVRVRWG